MNLLPVHYHFPGSNKDKIRTLTISSKLLFNVCMYATFAYRYNGEKE